MPRSTEEVCDAISNATWNDLWPRLLLFTKKLIARKYWRGVLGGNIPGGIDSCDIVMRAIEQALSGDRKWNGDSDLYSFLCSTITSNVNHLATGYENKKTVLLQWDSDCGVGEPHLEDTNLGPSDISERVRKRRMVERWLDVLKDDPLVYDIACYIVYYDIDEPSQLAERLGATVPDINNAKKRLRRRISESTFFVMAMDDDVDFERR